MVFKKGKKERVLSYFIKTYGGQMNVNDSEYLAGQLEEMDYKKTPDLNNADLIILNTCCVRKKVEQKIYRWQAGSVKLRKIIRKLFLEFVVVLRKRDREYKKYLILISYLDLPKHIFPGNYELYRQNEGKETIIFCDNREPLKLANKPINTIANNGYIPDYERMQ